MYDNEGVNNWEALLIKLDSNACAKLAYYSFEPWTDFDERMHW